MSDSKKIPWYKNIVFWGDVASTAGTVLMLSQPESDTYKIGAGITIATGLFTRWFGKKKEKYQRDQLPSGISLKVMDTLPNKFTGIKGSKK